MQKSPPISKGILEVYLRWSGPPHYDAREERSDWRLILRLHTVNALTGLPHPVLLTCDLLHDFVRTGFFQHGLKFFRLPDEAFILRPNPSDLLMPSYTPGDAMAVEESNPHEESYDGAYPEQPFRLAVQ